MRATIGVEATLADHGAAGSSSPDRQDRGEQEEAHTTYHQGIPVLLYGEMSHHTHRALVISISPQKGASWCVRLYDSYKAGALIEEYHTWGEPRPHLSHMPQIYLIRPSPLGEQYDRENWQGYRERYPNVDVLDLEQKRQTQSRDTNDSQL